MFIVLGRGCKRTECFGDRGTVGCLFCFSCSKSVKYDLYKNLSIGVFVQKSGGLNFKVAVKFNLFKV